MERKLISGGYACRVFSGLGSGLSCMRQASARDERSSVAAAQAETFTGLWEWMQWAVLAGNQQGAKANLRQVQIRRTFRAQVMGWAELCEAGTINIGHDNIEI